MLKLLPKAAAPAFLLSASMLMALAGGPVAAAPQTASGQPRSHYAATADAAAPFAERLRDGAADMVSTAMSLVGVRYRFGGTSAERGFDCSGFTREVFEASLGLLLPRRAEQQARAPGMLPVSRDALQPGDLVFFNTLRRTFSHVGIYVGDGKFIHSPRAGGEVRVDDMRFVYWAKRFTGARRAEAMADAMSDAMADDQTARGRADYVPGWLNAEALIADPLKSTPLRWDWLDGKTLNATPLPLGF